MNQLEILLIFSIVLKYCQSTSIYYYVPGTIKNITLPCEVDESEVKECYWTHDGKSVSDQDCDIVLSNITSQVFFKYIIYIQPFYTQKSPDIFYQM